MLIPCMARTTPQRERSSNHSAIHFHGSRLHSCCSLEQGTNFDSQDSTRKKNQSTAHDQAVAILQNDLNLKTSEPGNVRDDKTSPGLLPSALSILLRRNLGEFSLFRVDDFHWGGTCRTCLASFRCFFW